MDCSLPGSSVHGDSLGKNTGMGCHALLQGIFHIQGWNPHLLHLQHVKVGSFTLKALLIYTVGVELSYCFRPLSSLQLPPPSPAT